MVDYNDEFVYVDVDDDDTDVEWPEPHSIDDPTWFSIKGDY